MSSHSSCLLKFTVYWEKKINKMRHKYLLMWTVLWQSTELNREWWGSPDSSSWDGDKEGLSKEKLLSLTQTGKRQRVHKCNVSRWGDPSQPGISCQKAMWLCCGWTRAAEAAGGEPTRRTSGMCYGVFPFAKRMDSTLVRETSEKQPDFCLAFDQLHQIHISSVYSESNHTYS